MQDYLTPWQTAPAFLKNTGRRSSHCSSPQNRWVKVPGKDCTLRITSFAAMGGSWISNRNPGKPCSPFASLSTSRRILPPLLLWWQQRMEVSKDGEALTGDRMGSTVGAG